MPATRRTRPPFRTVVTLETLGEAEGSGQRLRVAVDHADGYIATAIPTVACLLQVLDGTVESGVQMMGYAVDVDRFMGDLERLGMKPTGTSTPA